MAAGSDSQVVHTPDSTGAGIRTIDVTTYINGVPTTVKMQVLAIADEAGNVIKDFSSYNLQLAQLREAQEFRRTFSMLHGAFAPIPEV